jgi:hypothetical protein
VKIALVQQHATRDPEENRERGRRAFLEAAGRAGVAICYDRHFPEYMRALRLLGAECDFRKNRECHARRHFLEDRRPGVYRKLGLMAKRPAD